MKNLYQQLKQEKKLVNRYEITQASKLIKSEITNLMKMQEIYYFSLLKN